MKLQLDKLVIILGFILYENNLFLFARVDKDLYFAGETAAGQARDPARAGAGGQKCKPGQGRDAQHDPARRQGSVQEQR